LNDDFPSYFGLSSKRSLLVILESDRFQDTATALFNSSFPEYKDGHTLESALMEMLITDDEENDGGFKILNPTAPQQIQLASWEYCIWTIYHSTEEHRNQPGGIFWHKDISPAEARHRIFQLFQLEQLRRRERSLRKSMKEACTRYAEFGREHLKILSGYVSGPYADEASDESTDLEDGENMIAEKKTDTENKGVADGLLDLNELVNLLGTYKI
jgi:hypothetical protein